ncbi:MAG: hypothetical protein CMM73_04185 [Rhodospirillaceae bacterium]|nr:hypothetical protein [Rhodospirillaceae bacterium]|tara:strand:+ start:2307 stop:3269 length:963 start_codon:yes stop_codon:yes gene_type:complete
MEKLDQPNAVDNDRLPLVCVCKSKTKLLIRGDVYICSDNKCVHSDLGGGFKIIDGIPLIISKSHTDTVFNPDQIQTYVKRQGPRLATLRAFFSIPSKVTIKNAGAFVSKIKENQATPKILIIGSAEKGSGTEEIWTDCDIERYGVDVYATQSVDVICDAHYIPYGDSVFDGVWIQAVLEHVLEPNKVVGEIHRVLKDGGVVYAETPFMQQVHEGAYDFTRYTVLGHRYLFRDFEALDFGGNKGANVSLAWSLKYFAWAITRSHIVARIVGIIAGFLLKPFGYLLSKESLFDSSSGVFFLGKKSNLRLAHKDIIKLYRGHI